MKKKVLIIMSSLKIAGAEKSLISLLNNVDYNFIEIDLLLFSKTGALLNDVPKEVNVITFNDINSKALLSLNTYDAIKYLLKLKKYHIAYFRLLVAIKRKIIKKSHPGQIGWERISRYIPNFIYEYETAIAYINNAPIYYLIDKVKAQRKIGFIRSDYKASGYNDKIDRPYFDKLNCIATVSEKNAKIISTIFPEYSNKILVMKNITDAKYIEELSKEEIDFDKNFQGTKIVTLARDDLAKGIDLAVNACKLLTRRGVNLKWYVIGSCESRNMRLLVEKEKLSNHFIFLGEKRNPYPYLLGADIYVQPSRREGRCNSILEAMILGKPIIITNFPTASEQVTDGVNGLIVPLTSEGIANGIEILLNGKGLKEKIAKNAKNTKVNNLEEINMFYTMLAGL